MAASWQSLDRRILVEETLTAQRTSTAEQTSNVGQASAAQLTLI